MDVNNKYKTSQICEGNFQNILLPIITINVFKQILQMVITSAVL